MIRELILLGLRLSVITFAASGVGLALLFFKNPFPGDSDLLTLALMQSMIGIIICFAALKMIDEKNPD